MRTTGWSIVRRPGQEREVDGWDAFVHVMRHRWWLGVVTLVVLATGIVLRVWLAASTGCAFVGDQVSCQTVPGQMFLEPLSVFLIGASLGPVGWMFQKWMHLRVGAYRPAPCPSCGVDGGPVHPDCKGWLIGKATGDDEVFKQRRHLAWRSVFPRLFSICILLALAGAGATAYGLSTPHEDNMDECFSPGPVGEVRQCSNEDTSGRSDWITGGLLVVWGAITWFGLALTYRLVHPRLVVEEDLGRPPGLA